MSTDSSFTIHDLNTITENNQDESLARIKTDSKLFEFIQEVGAKPFTSIEECADFHYKLMQIIADQLELGVKIDTDFIEDPANEDVIMLIT